MLQSLVIKNFQAHERIKIQLDSGITTIVGPSDVGKSAIIRAIRWVMLNQPRGADFIREGADQVSVKLTLDSQIVKRTRGDGVNSYEVGDKKFEAFNNDIPPEVARLLNVSGLNFQNQHDNVFWFSETAGEVSRQLNNIIDLGSIDKVLGYLNSQLREATGRVTYSTERLEAARIACKALKPVEAADRELRRIEALDTHWKGLFQKAGVLAEATQDVKNGQEQATRAKGKFKAARELLQLGEVVSQIITKQEKLAIVIAQAKTLQKKIHPLPSTPVVDKLVKLNQTYKAQIDQYWALFQNVQTYKKIHQQIKENTGALEVTQRKLKEALGKRCPLCQQKIS